MDLISLLGIPAMAAIAVGTILVWLWLWLLISCVRVRRSPPAMAEAGLKENLGAESPPRPPGPGGSVGR